MLRFLKWFFALFSSYVNPFERKVDRFFRNVKSTDSIANIKGELLVLMQENLIVVNVWLEKKFKGYKYLTKRVRRQMYVDLEIVVKKFQDEMTADAFTVDSVKETFKLQGLNFPTGDEQKVLYLYQIMQFMFPGKYYKYIKTASFGKLLRNPENQMMEGDCNQIVTFYIYLYSLKFPIEDLRIKLLPEHVCLHFREIDIEATNATFQKYQENLEVLPVTEIISTNLLDLNDFREDVQSIEPRVMVKSAQLAYAISSLKSLVAKNLNIAYRNLALSALSLNNFDSAIFYLGMTDRKDELIAIYNKATVYFMDQKNFSKAGYFADLSKDQNLVKTVKYNEGVYYFNLDQIEKALAIFTALGDDKMKKACYQKQYNLLSKRVAGVKTLADAKSKKSVYQSMLGLAEKIGDGILENSIRDTLNKIG